MSCSWSSGRCASCACRLRSGSRWKPSSGISTTAANHDAIGAIADTSKIERVYSPVLDFASAIGRKPDTVTSVPVSIGNAVLV